MRQPQLRVLFGIAACALACNGKIGAQHNGGSGTGGSGMPTPDAQGNLPYSTPQPAAAALPARMWRLTHVEYKRSVKDLTGIDVDTTNFEAETDGGMFANISNVNFVRLNLAT